MYLTLSKRRKAKVGISHFADDSGRRGTKVWVKVGRKTFEAVAVCSKHDNFCRRTGRKLAACRLLDNIRGQPSFSKEDRASIFYFYCPEFKEGR